MVNPGGAVKVDVQPGSAPPPILGEKAAVPAVACDFHTPGAVTSPVGPPHAAPTGSTTLPTGTGAIDADGEGGVPDEEGVDEPVREPVELPVIEAVGELVLEGVVPALHEGVGVLVEEAVREGVEEHVGTSAVLPTEQDEGQPHAAHVAIEVAPRAALNVPAPHCVHAAIEVAPRAALNVPAPHCVHAALPATLKVPAPHSEGVTELAGQKEPAGQADVVMVYEMPLARMLVSL